jgi:hypothetical protein
MEWIDDEVEDEPGERYSEKWDPIPFDGEPVRDANPLHGVLLVMHRLVHVQPPEEDEKGRNKAKTEGYTPDGTKVMFTEYPEKDKRNKRGNSHSQANHRVYNEVSIR